MSKPRYRWWGYIKNVIRAYPALKAEYEALKEPSITASMSGMPGAGNVSDPTAQTALRELPGTKQREYEAVKKAIEATQRLAVGKETLEIVDMVFWKNRYTLNGAAYHAHISYESAKRYQRDFILCVARNYGLMDGDGR